MWKGTSCSALPSCVLHYISLFNMGGYNCIVLCQQHAISQITIHSVGVASLPGLLLPLLLLFLHCCRGVAKEEDGLGTRLVKGNSALGGGGGGGALE